MDLKNVRLRQLVIRTIRNFFLHSGFEEVTPPVLAPSLPLEPSIYAFETVWQTARGKNTLYLSTSPEAGLKKTLASGARNVFAIAPAFRNIEEANATHVPEFLMVEWYRTDSDTSVIMDDARTMIVSVKKHLDTYLVIKPGTSCTYKDHLIDLDGHWPIVGLTELWGKYAGVSLERIMTDKTMIACAKRKGYNTDHASWEQLYNQIFLNEIEPHIGYDPRFITEYPSRISPLCKPKTDEPDVAERFELYLGGMELGNGNMEYTDSHAVSQTFIGEKLSREKQGLTTPPVDTSFLKALSRMDGHQYAGMGLGIDRLSMVLADTSQISDMNPFRN
jgi:lysyl-tRNA synthetase class 2